MAIKSNILKGTDFASEGIADHDMNATLGAAITFGATIEGLNNIRTLIDRNAPLSKGAIDGYVEAFTDASGQRDKVESYTATFDTNKFKNTTTTGGIPFVAITCTSLTKANFIVNDCVIGKIGSKKWLVFCTVGTNAVRRAQIYKTLAYGTDGTNSGLSTVTGCTEIATNVSRDVGKRFHYARYSHSDESFQNSPTVTGTFSDTTNNTYCSSWSLCEAYASVPAGAPSIAYWNIPYATNRNSASDDDGETIVDELGTDLEADENDNPANCRMNGVTPYSSVFTQSMYVISIVLCKGALTWSTPPYGTLIDTDFYTDYNILDLTLASDDDLMSVVSLSIDSGTFGSAIKSAVGVPLIQDWDGGAGEDIQFKLVNTSEDSGWFSKASSTKFAVFTSQPAYLLIKLVPQAAGASAGYPSIRGAWVYAN